MNETFISYSRKDWDTAEKIIKALKKKDIDPWYDHEDIPPAAPWRSEMLLGVQCSQSFVYLISPDSIVSAACQEELDCALRHNKRIIPVVARSPGVAPLHPAISELNWIFFNNFESGLNKLVNIIENPFEYQYLLNNRQQSFLETYCGESGELGKIVPLLRNKYLVGRHPSVDLNECGAISVPDKSRMISRAHLELSWNHSQAGWRYRDLSQNGVALFPRLKPEEILRHNTRIFLSSECYLLFKILDPENKTEYEDSTPTEGAT